MQPSVYLFMKDLVRVSTHSASSSKHFSEAIDYKTLTAIPSITHSIPLEN